MVALVLSTSVRTTGKMSYAHLLLQLCVLLVATMRSSLPASAMSPGGTGNIAARRPRPAPLARESEVPASQGTYVGDSLDAIDMNAFQEHRGLSAASGAAQPQLVALPSMIKPKSPTQQLAAVVSSKGTKKSSEPSNKQILKDILSKNVPTP